MHEWKTFSQSVEAAHPAGNSSLQLFIVLSLQVIYVMRNPKNVFTFYFHFSEMASFHVKPGSSSEILHKFLDGKGASPHPQCSNAIQKTS